MAIRAPDGANKQNMKGRHPSVPSISLCFSIHFLSIQKLLIYIFLKPLSYLSSKHATSWFPSYQVRFSTHFFSNQKLSLNFAIFVCKTRRPCVPSILDPVFFLSIHFFQFKNLLFSFFKTQHFNTLFDS